MTDVLRLTGYVDGDHVQQRKTCSVVSTVHQKNVGVKMGKLKSWTCKGCLNIRAEIVNYNGKTEIAEYCSIARDFGEFRTEWHGDTIVCLDKRTEG